MKPYHVRVIVGANDDGKGGFMLTDQAFTKESTADKFAEVMMEEVDASHPDKRVDVDRFFYNGREWESTGTTTILRSTGGKEKP